MKTRILLKAAVIVTTLTLLSVTNGMASIRWNLENDPVNANFCIVDLPTDEIFMNQYHVATNAFFDLYFTGIIGDFDVENNVHYDGWCIDHPTPLPTTLTYTVFVYSSYCVPEKFLVDTRGNIVDWGKINHIINHKIGSVNDIQAAIRYFVNFGSSENWPGPDSQSNYQTMIDNAESSYIPAPGDFVAVIIDTNPNTPMSPYHSYQYLIFELPIPFQWCYEGETAWAQGPRYVPRGNWAMYYKYTGGITNTPLIAGQFFNAGSVEISDNTDGTVTITISLDDHWYFTYDDVVYEENVKIQDYANVPPKKNPAPGLFAHKFTATGQLFQCIVPYNNYYGIHVDLWHQVPCDMPLWYSLALRLCQLCQYLPNAFPLLRYILNNYNNY